MKWKILVYFVSTSPFMNTFMNDRFQYGLAFSFFPSQYYIVLFKFAVMCGKLN